MSGICSVGSNCAPQRPQPQTEAPPQAQPVQRAPGYSNEDTFQTANTAPQQAQAAPQAKPKKKGFFAKLMETLMPMLQQLLPMLGQLGGAQRQQ